ncbi:MAG: PqqD family protein [Solirubrobacteraceae bacterium]
MRLPLARSEGLVVEELGDEILVYDLDVKNAHCLSPTAARVWRLCDGGTSADAIARELALRDDDVTSALEELDRADLLVSPTMPGDGLSRRELGLKVTKVAVGVATVPLILSIAAPAAAATASQIALCAAIDFSKNGCGACNNPPGGGKCCCCSQADGSFKNCAADQADCTSQGGGNCTRNT